jgi:hypothetical protein
MTTFESNNFEKSILSPHSAGEVYVSDDIVALPVTLALNDLAKVGHLPADCIPIDVVAIADELDEHATDTLTFSVGMMNDDGDDLVTAETFITGAQADTDPTVTRAAGAGLKGIARNKTTDRVLGIKITAAGATKAAGNVRVIMTYRASDYGA